MKFKSLFEESKKIPTYDKTIINHVKSLIEDFESRKSKESKTNEDNPGSITSTEPSDGLSDEKGLLFDNDSLDLSKPDFLEDEAFNNLKKIQSNETEESDESKKAEELAKNLTLSNEDYFLADDPIEESDASDLKKEVQEVDVKEDDPEALRIYDELINLIQDKDYDETVDFVDDIVKDPKLRFLLSLGFGGEFANLKLKLNKTTIPAKRLVPTQNEIGTDETLRYIKEGKDIDVCFDKSTIVKKPIVTFQGTFIVDGHHRWSQIFVTNPDANVVCIDITGNLSPLSMLKAVQCTIGSNLGKLIRKDIQGENLYDVSESKIKKYLEAIPEKVLENLKEYYTDPIEALTKNVIQLQRNNTPILNAPDRGEMPQTSKDPELFDDLKNGVTDV